jgi:hypothetical protein
MKKLLIFTYTLFITLLCYSQHDRGISISYSTADVIGIEIFGIDGNKRIHFGYSYQMGEQKIEIIKRPNLNYGQTKTEDGSYFWLIDCGYSQIFINKITIHSELSVGSKREFINYEDDRFSDHGYSLITKTKMTAGIGLSLGYFINSSIEPFVGLHTLKKVNLGIRFSW